MPYSLKQLFPGRRGARAALHDLEAAVMDVVWDDPRSELTVRDVMNSLQPERGLAYTTVMTTMDRLAKRDLLERHKEHRAWVYRAALDRAGFLDLVARQALEGLPKGARRSALAWFVDEVSGANEDELDFLSDLIARKRAERSSG